MTDDTDTVTANDDNIQNLINLIVNDIFCHENYVFMIFLAIFLLNSGISAIFHNFQNLHDFLNFSGEFVTAAK